jgi:hypothetical protein
MPHVYFYFNAECHRPCAVTLQAKVGRDFRTARV